MSKSSLASRSWSLWLCLLVLAVACSDPERTVVTQVVGPSGGTIEGPAGAILTVPSGALPADTSITVSVASEGSHPPLGASFAVAGQVFAFEPHGLAFAAPVTISLPVASPSGDLAVLRSEPDAPWEAFPAEIGTTATFTTSSFSWYCVARPLDGTPVDAAVDAASDADATAGCAARSPATTSSATVSDMTGTAPAYNAGSQTWPELALATVVGGYAQLSGSGTVIIQLTDYASACGMFNQGIHKIGGKSLQLYLYSPPISVGTYAGGMYVATRQPAPSSTAQGACTIDGFADGMPPSSRTMTISAIDASHVAGSFSVVYQGETLSGTFDVPFCTMATNLDPAACCVP